MAPTFDPRNTELTRLMKRPSGVNRLLEESPMTEGDEQEKPKANILGDLMGILSRPSAASAQGVFNATDDDPNTGFGGGFMQGLRGKGQVTYKDVLQENLGVENDAVAAIGGFIGDVALDPLMYVGIKGTKGVGQTESLMKAIKSGAPDVAAEAERIMAKNPTRLGLTVAGKPMGSLKIPGQARKAVERLLGPAEDKALLPRMFSRDADLPLGLNQMERVIESSHASQYDMFQREMSKLYDGLTPAERVQAAHGLDTGQNTVGQTVLAPNKTRFPMMDEYISGSRKILDDMFVEEGKMGLFTLKKGKNITGNLPTDYVEYNPQYAYRYFKKPPADLATGSVTVQTLVGGTNTAGFMKKRKADVTLEEARKLLWEPVDDISEMMKLRASKHYRTMSRASFVRDAIDQFSIDATELKQLQNQGIKDLGWVSADNIISPVAANRGDRFVPAFISKAVNMAEDTFKNGSTGSKVMKLYDQALGHWKFANTAMMPGFHIRNTASDIIMNAADGVWNPQRYSQAAKVMADRKSVVDRGLNQLLSPGATTQVPTGHAKIKLGGRSVSSDDVWKLYGQSGAQSGIITSEVQRNLTSWQKKGLTDRAAAGKAAIGNMAEGREDWIRMAHFIDATDNIMKKSKKPMTVEDAAMQAGQRVRKFNIDYGNLSTFERNTMKRIVPFYTWMRRATPLNMELLFTKPGFMALYPKSIDLAQGLLGTDNAEGESLIPEWIRSSAPVRVALAKQEARNPVQAWLANQMGAGDNEAMFLNTNTLSPMSVLQAPGNVVKGLAQGDPVQAARGLVEPFVQGATPVAKLPLELTTGRNTFTGQEITSYKDWLADQVSYGRLGTAAPEKGMGNTAASLLGVPMQVATGERQEGEFRRRQDNLNSIRRDTKLQKLREKFPDFDELPEARREAYLSKLRLKPDKAEREQRRYLTQIMGQ